MITNYFHSNMTLLDEFEYMAKGVLITQEAKESRERYVQERFSLGIILCQTTAVSCIAFSILFCFTSSVLVAGVTFCATILPLGIWKLCDTEKKRIEEDFYEQCRVVCNIFTEMTKHIKGVIIKKEDFILQIYDNENRNWDFFKGASNYTTLVNKKLKPIIDEYNEENGINVLLNHVRVIGKRIYLFPNAPQFFNETFLKLSAMMTQFDRREKENHYLCFSDATGIVSKVSSQAGYFLD